MKGLLQSDGFKNLGIEVNNLYKKQTVCPKKEDIFNAFKYCPYEKCRVVLLGQDPYHDFFDNAPRAQGLSFANPSGTHFGTMSPSLKIMHGELENDLKKLVVDFDPTLKNWAAQGVLLLNTALTVQKGNANSHKALWQPFTKRVIEFIDRELNPIWILLGKQAQTYKVYMTEIFEGAGPFTVEAPHPAAEIYTGGKAGFIGSRIFSRTNDMLYMMDKKPIDWVKSFNI